MAFYFAKTIKILKCEIKNLPPRRKEIGQTMENQRNRINFRITDDGNEQDIADIYEMLKEYNLSNREQSENVPIGIFVEVLI